MAKKSSKKTTSKKAAKKKAAKKKTTTKAPAKKSAAKTSAKKAAKKAAKKSTAKKASPKKSSSKKASAKKSDTKKAAKKKTSKKGAKKLSKAVSGEQFAPGSKPKLSINLAPKGYKRNIAPGVAIDANMVHPGLKNINDNHKDEPRRKLAAKELRKIHDLLIEKREQILTEIRHQVGDSLSRNSEVKTDTVDRASDVLDGDVSYEMAVAGHHELEEIEAALEKIERKTYGQCEACDEDIAASRLKVIPFATLCAKCRQLKEIGGGDNGSESIWGFLDADAEDQPDD